MDLQTSESERKRARHLHAVLLFNLVVNHIFLFLMALTLLNQSIIPMVLVVLISLTLLGYILVCAKRSRANDSSWYVCCHCQFAAKRARLFLFLFIALGSLSLILYYGGIAMHMKAVETWALTGGFGLLPFMVAVLGLIVIEFDAEHQSKTGRVPAGAIAYYPPPMEENEAGKPLSGGTQKA
jgi:hypothetical protein